jgi:hypothetical protein
MFSCFTSRTHKSFWNKLTELWINHCWWKERAWNADYSEFNDEIRILCTEYTERLWFRTWHLKIIETSHLHYHYMYFNKFVSSSSSFKIFSQQRYNSDWLHMIFIQLHIHQSLSRQFVVHNWCDMRKCFMKCAFVCENIQMTHFNKMNFAERVLLSHEKKNWQSSLRCAA